MVRKRKGRRGSGSGSGSGEENKSEKRADAIDLLKGKSGSSSRWLFLTSQKIISIFFKVTFTAK